MATSRLALAPEWYAAALGPPFRSLDDALGERFSPRLLRLARRLGALHGILIHRAVRDADRVALVKESPGTATFLAFEALAGRRRTVLLEFLPRGRPRARWAQLAHRTRFAVDGVLVRRAMLAGQCLTTEERQRYAEDYRIPAERLVHVPWALRRDDQPLPQFDSNATAVLCSGRGGSDWETLFAAAAGGGWDLTVVCARPDLKRVERLNADVGARVLTEISRREHDQHLRHAGVYVIALLGAWPSTGHVRLMAAVGAGAPVVASRVPALDGYAVDRETALLVPPADSQALRSAVEELVASPALRERLRLRAWSRAGGWTYRQYFAAIRALVLRDA